MQQLDLLTKQPTNNKLRVSRASMPLTKKQLEAKYAKEHDLSPGQIVRILTTPSQLLPVGEIGSMGFLPVGNVTCYWWHDEGKTWERTK